MLIDGGIGSDLNLAGESAIKAEQAGYDAVWSAETAHDPMLPLLIAAEHTETIGLGTGIVVAFGRSPMTLANSAWDLNHFSGGRFMLGLGSQIKPHIEKRFSMPWSHPAPRMREFILAMRAIWDCWQNGTKLDFRGDFYTHTLMTPFFDPGPNSFGPPKVFLAAVGEGMAKVAAEVADGMLVHGFTTEKYLREVTLPAIERGLAASGRTRADFQLSYPAFIVTGDTDEEVAAADAGTRKQIAFYASTPSYRGVLEAHGWGELQTELNALSKQGEWDEMGRRVSDEVLDAFAVRGTPEEIPSELHRRFGDVIDRISLYMPYKDSGVTPRILAGLREIR
ncbi:MAG TPA: LLM class F420-dependent oxidoreductase [Acidimicrobiales bacterium]|jgi:probable F420-dependent oxidoreductase|nr:LLM class F420-dependent oxidoreductase [Acidimicrobiales bacterium]